MECKKRNPTLVQLHSTKGNTISWPRSRFSEKTHFPPKCCIHWHTGTIKSRDPTDTNWFNKRSNWRPFVKDKVRTGESEPGKWEWNKSRGGPKNYLVTRLAFKSKERLRTNELPFYKIKNPSALNAGLFLHLAPRCFISRLRLCNIYCPIVAQFNSFKMQI